jgi:hypothetical protein
MRESTRMQIAALFVDAEVVDIEQNVRDWIARDWIPIMSR